ncbi:MAG: CtsR family transcriptional regulator [Synergistetes bacterium]|nr:CtsR family transcriptional regulator [Synergistota bacterium]MCX8127264.1 CtsR family transcriptional regulator [Synergistota bacterium]MDW8191850.1 CtsR family transcriptional regulator [Synergistota bacterium]
MSLASHIEAYIKKLLTEASSEVIRLQRRELARRFGCVPSQINYVIRTRFTPDRGYIVESQRGGGGYIRIIKVNVPLRESLLERLDSEIGEAIDRSRARGLISRLANDKHVSLRERLLIESALSALDEILDELGDFPEYKYNIARAFLLKKLLCSVLGGDDEDNGVSEL